MGLTLGRWVLCGVFIGVILQPEFARGALIAVGPSDPWCDEINKSGPGDDIVFASGSYTTPCGITAKGNANAPIVIRAQSDQPSQQAVFAYPGSTSNVMELRSGASHLVLRGFRFAPTQADVDAIRIRQASDIVIEMNTFEGIGGVSITANDSSTERITVRRNTFKNLHSTGIYLGCHDGTACQATSFLIEANLIDGVTTPHNPSSIGYGMEIKLNSFGTIRDNTVYRTKGPGIMVYGSNRGNPANLVEGNYTEGSVNEAGIVIGGGPAVVRNNVVVSNAFGGISAQNYNSRNLQQNIWVVHNTVLNNDDSGINVQGWNAGSGNVIAYNAIVPGAGTSALRPSSPMGTLAGNVTCTALCFVQATASPYDLRPTTGSPLLDAAGNGTESWRPLLDFMGATRAAPADVGAFERSLLSVSYVLGSGNPRPPRISIDSNPPAAPANLKIQ